jgi:GTPase
MAWRPPGQPRLALLPYIMAKPIVAIVGRPNVGKSTFFNRIVGQPIAIVEDLPGTTRDRLYADGEWGGRPFTLVDTGGLDPTSTEDYAARVRAQAELAIAEADVIIFLVDAREGITATDQEIAEILRRTAKPVILAANKADNTRRRLDSVEFYTLGLDEPLAISSVHGTGTGDVLDKIVASFPLSEEEEPEATAKIAIVGRPNVGKSSLLNALLGKERAIVSERPGTTRDAIDTVLERDGERIVLIDTAGIRKRGKVERGIEKYSVLRALRAIDRADVVALLIDAVDGVTAQDTHIAGYVAEAFKGLVIAVNKWDLVRAEAAAWQPPASDVPLARRRPRGQAAAAPAPRADYRQEYERLVREQFNFVAYAPILFISAKTGQRLSQVLDVALEVRTRRRQRVGTSPLNVMVQEAIHGHNPPTDHGRQLKVLYATQAAIEPPTFVFFVNDPHLLHFSYQRYLENELRQRFDLVGVPIKLVFKKRGEE